MKIIVSRMVVRHETISVPDHLAPLYRKDWSERTDEEEALLEDFEEWFSIPKADEEVVLGWEIYDIID